MNKLSYGLLSFLSIEDQTGYDLMLRLNQFWHTTHSAIYPLLAELEEKDYVTSTLIKQIGKPDKRLYSITGQGREVLKEWIISPTDAAVIKDEMHLKLFCIQALDKETIEKLLTEMENRYAKDLDRYMASLEKLKNAANGNMESFHSPKMGSYILLQKRIGETKVGMKWCSWIRKLYKQSGKINFFDHDFTDFAE